jgi:hypothetical protein
LLGTAARTAVIAGTATSVAGKVAQGQQARAQQAMVAQQHDDAQQQARIDAAVAAGLAGRDVPSAPTADRPAGGLSDDLVKQLKSLAELRDVGVLTDDEFSAKKAKLLGI